MPIPDESTGLERTLLRDVVYRRLRDAIVDGTFQPGEQLKDGDLAEWLGVSRTPVREALLRLGASGLVVAVRGRSTTVSAIEPESVRDARDVVAAMHRLATLTAADRLTEGDVRRMRDLNERFARALSDGDVAAAVDADEEFHGVVIAAAGNAAIASVLDQFEPVVRRAELARFSEDGDASIARHQHMIDLLVARDVNGAATLAHDIWSSLRVEG